MKEYGNHIINRTLNDMIFDKLSLSWNCCFTTLYNRSKERNFSTDFSPFSHYLNHTYPRTLIWCQTKFPDVPESEIAYDELNRYLRWRDYIIDENLPLAGGSRIRPDIYKINDKLLTCSEVYIDGVKTKLQKIYYKKFNK